MAELALKYSTSASRAFTDSILKKPHYEVNKMIEGIRVTCSSDATKKVSPEIWRLDQNSNSIICDKVGGIRLYLCSPQTKHLDVSTITRIKDSDDSDNVVTMTYLDPELSKNVSMTLSFEDEANCVSFLKVIGYLMSKARLDDAHFRQFEYLCKMFNVLDENSNGFLSLNELDKLYTKLKIRKKDQLFAFLFKEVQHESPKGMTLSEFILFHNMLNTHPDIELIFCPYAFANGSINVHQFTRLLKNEQYEKDASPQYAQQLLQKLEVNENSMIGLELTINGFINYIFDPQYNGITNPKFTLSPHQNMDRPLNHYFIKSCYVTGTNSSELSLNYQKALATGYRHFELDIYGSDVSHAIFINTSKESSSTIELSELIGIFNKADLRFGPLILTMKLHINSPQLLTIIANTLLINLTENKLILFDENIDEMPILSQLANKVLIRSSFSLAKQIESSLIDSSDDILFSKLISLDDITISSSRSTSSQKNSSNIKINNDMMNSSSDNVSNLNDPDYYFHPDTNINNESSQWNQTITFQNDNFAHFSDSKGETALHITSTYMVTVSPKSSIHMCSPTLFWNYGVQSVVQPFPRFGIYSQLNDAFFALNGNSGYNLKPDELYAEALLRSQQSTQDLSTPTNENNVNDIEYANLRNSNNNNFEDRTQNDLMYQFEHNQYFNDRINVTISIICGRFMPSLNLKPFVYLELYGPIPMYGTTDVSEGSRIVYKINPRYNNQFEFDLPRSAYKQTLVAFSLWDNQALSEQLDNQIIGRSVAHIANLRQGFRNVTLYDSKGNSLDPTSLLVHVKKCVVQEYANVTSMMSSPLE